MLLLNQTTRPIQILAAQGHDNFRNRRAMSEFTRGVHQDRRTLQQHELLAAGAGFFPAHACSQPRGRKNNGYLHGRVYDCNWWDGLRPCSGYRDLFAQWPVFVGAAVIFARKSRLDGAVNGVDAVVKAAKNHLASRGLQDAGDGDVDGL